LERQPLVFVNFAITCTSARLSQFSPIRKTLGS
jgi:hypothetical protein